MAFAASLVGIPSAGATPTPLVDGVATTVTYTGASVQYITASDVCSVDIEALGGAGGAGYTGTSAGGSGYSGHAGGAGGSASVQISVSGVQTLTVSVGGGGGDGTSLLAGVGGFGGGGSATIDTTAFSYAGGGGGGGESSVQIGATTEVVAGGGGGGSTTDYANGYTGYVGGSGGTGANSAGSNGGDFNPQDIAGAGTLSAGGVAPTGGDIGVAGTSGSANSGGTGAFTTDESAGGGGSGYFGGAGGGVGSGGGGYTNFFPGSGAGGSTYAVAGAYAGPSWTPPSQSNGEIILTAVACPPPTVFTPSSPQDVVVTQSSTTLSAQWLAPSVTYGMAVSYYCVVITSGYESAGLASATTSTTCSFPVASLSAGDGIGVAAFIGSGQSALVTSFPVLASSPSSSGVTPLVVLICVRHHQAKIVRGVNPHCPKGYTIWK